MTDLCDVAGCGEPVALYATNKRRCLAHANEPGTWSSFAPETKAQRERDLAGAVDRINAAGRVCEDCQGKERIGDEPWPWNRCVSCHGTGHVCDACNPAVRAGEAVFVAAATAEVMPGGIMSVGTIRQAVLDRVDAEPSRDFIGEPERRLWRRRLAEALMREVNAKHEAARERETADELAAMNRDACSQILTEAARAEAAHDALDAILLRHAEVERVLEMWPADGAFALKVLRGDVGR